MAYFKKDMKIATSYKVQFLFQFLQIFFSVTIIYFIGKMLPAKTQMSLFKKYNCSYFQFALVGLAVNGYLRAGLVTITNDLRQAMNQGVLEIIFTANTNLATNLFFMSIWQFVFETVKVFAYFVLAIVLFGTEFSNINILSAFAAMTLTVSIFLFLGIISCSLLILLKKGDPVNWIFSSIGAIFAGTMFPIELLPKWMQALSPLMPLTHSISAMRRAMLNSANLCEIKNSLISLCIFLLVLMPTAVLISNICLSKSKKNGALATH